MKDRSKPSTAAHGVHRMKIKLDENMPAAISRALVSTIRELMQPPAQPKRRPIGFHAAKEGE